MTQTTTRNALVNTRGFLDGRNGHPLPIGADPDYAAGHAEGMEARQADAAAERDAHNAAGRSYDYRLNYRRGRDGEPRIGEDQDSRDGHWAGIEARAAAGQADNRWLAEQRGYRDGYTNRHRFTNFYVPYQADYTTAYDRGAADRRAEFDAGYQAMDDFKREELENARQLTAKVADHVEIIDGQEIRQVVSNPENFINIPQPKEVATA